MSYIVEDFVEPTYLVKIIGHKEDGTPIVEPQLTDSNRKKVENILKEMGF